MADNKSIDDAIITGAGALRDDAVSAQDYACAFPSFAYAQSPAMDGHFAVALKSYHNKDTPLFAITYWGKDGSFEQYEETVEEGAIVANAFRGTYDAQGVNKTRADSLPPHIDNAFDCHLAMIRNNLKQEAELNTRMYEKRTEKIFSGEETLPHMIRDPKYSAQRNEIDSRHRGFQDMHHDVIYPPQRKYSSSLHERENPASA